MYKKVIVVLVILVVAALIVLNVGQRTGVLKMGRLKVGMVTDAGTIDDKSFNQGTWEGVLQAGEELGLETKYLKAFSVLTKLPYVPREQLSFPLV